MIDIQKLIAEKVRFKVEVDIKVAGYIEGQEPKTETVGHMELNDLTKAETEMVVGNITEVMDWVADRIEQD